jgi:hypothetical protein
MKKALLLLTAIVLITACQSANQNSNSAGNQNANQIAVAGDEPSCESSNDQQVVKEIFIDSAPSGAQIRRPVDDIIIGVGDKKVVWCINNQSSVVINVLINNLRVNKSPEEKNPFGDGGWRDNTFVSKLIHNGRVKNLKTKVAFKFGTYKYDILVTDQDGNPLDFEDPQVVISEGFPKSIAGNKNANTNSNSRK